MEPEKYLNQKYQKESSGHCQILHKINNNASNSNTISVVPSSDTNELTLSTSSNISHLINPPDTSSFYLDEINLEHSMGVPVVNLTNGNENMLGFTNSNFLHLQQPIQVGVNECRETSIQTTSSIEHESQRSNNATGNNEGGSTTVQLGNSNIDPEFAAQNHSPSTSTVTMDYISTPQQHLFSNNNQSHSINLIPAFVNEEGSSITTLNSMVHMEDKSTSNNIQNELSMMENVSDDVSSHKSMIQVPTSIAASTFTTLQPLDYHFIETNKRANSDLLAINSHESASKSFIDVGEKFGPSQFCSETDSRLLQMIYLQPKSFNDNTNGVFPHGNSEMTTTDLLAPTCHVTASSASLPPSPSVQVCLDCGNQIPSTSSNRNSGCPLHETTYNLHANDLNTIPTTIPGFINIRGKCGPNINYQEERKIEMQQMISKSSNEKEVLLSSCQQGSDGITNQLAIPSSSLLSGNTPCQTSASSSAVFHVIKDTLITNGSEPLKKALLSALGTPSLPEYSKVQKRSDLIPSSSRQDNAISENTKYRVVTSQKDQDEALDLRGQQNHEIVALSNTVQVVAPHHETSNPVENKEDRYVRISEDNSKLAGSRTMDKGGLSVDDKSIGSITTGENPMFTMAPISINGTTSNASLPEVNQIPCQNMSSNPETGYEHMPQYVILQTQNIQQNGKKYDDALSRTIYVNEKDSNACSSPNERILLGAVERSSYRNLECVEKKSDKKVENISWEDPQNPNLNEAQTINKNISASLIKDPEQGKKNYNIVKNKRTLKQPDTNEIKDDFDIEEDHLLKFSVRDLNKILHGMPKHKQRMLKQKRRTLKNRGYAQNCRSKRMVARQDLEVTNTTLHQNMQNMISELTNAKKQCEMLRELLQKEQREKKQLEDIVRLLQGS